MSGLLAAPLGPDRVEAEALLVRIARLAVPILGDFCAIDLVDESGALHRAACAHVDAALEGLARAVQVEHAIPASAAPTAVAEAVTRAAQRDLFPRIGAVMWIVAPMVARDRVLGTLMLAISESERDFADADRLLADALASQVAVAIDHAALFRQAGADRNAAEAAMRARDDFLSTLSHELRSPLNAVYGWATMLDRGQLDPAQSRHAFQVILRNVSTQVRLIDDLLDVSRVASGKVRLFVQPVDLEAVVQDAIETIRPTADAKGIRVQSVLASPGGPISGDRDRLQQVVWNLLGNAVKFTPKGGRVQVRLQRVRSQVEVVVSDTGQGIEPDLLPHVFDRFRQGDRAGTRPHGGLGLGLALVRGLVELHGGTVAARSAGVGAGATFVVRLPVMLTGSTEPVPDDSAEGDGARPPAEEQSLAGLRVLVVDDDPTAVELARAFLVRAGADARGCLSGVEALETLRQWRPDVLLSDIEMPGLDGYTLVRQVRALGPGDGGQTPAVAVSAYSLPENRVRSLRAGFNMHVSKPVEPGELIAIVASLAGRNGS
jgi:signal transduction histidine kinase/ActR/RegA family two-component response regulator